MPRLLLTDKHWSNLRQILLHTAIYNKRDLRMTVEGMLYRMRTGCPWRDLPARISTGSVASQMESMRIIERVHG